MNRIIGWILWKLRFNVVKVIDGGEIRKFIYKNGRVYPRIVNETYHYDWLQEKEMNEK